MNAAAIHGPTELDPTRSYFPNGIEFETSQALLNLASLSLVIRADRVVGEELVFSTLRASSMINPLLDTNLDWQRPTEI